jgi:hypothetical protein
MASLIPSANPVPNADPTQAKPDAVPVATSPSGEKPHGLAQALADRKLLEAAGKRARSAMAMPDIDVGFDAEADVLGKKKSSWF